MTGQMAQDTVKIAAGQAAGTQANGWLRMAFFENRYPSMRRG